MPPAAQSFNAADLLDPEALAGLSGEPAQPETPAANLFNPAAHQAPYGPGTFNAIDLFNAPPQPTINAADLFDASILQGLSAPKEEQRPSPPRTPPRFSLSPLAPPAAPPRSRPFKAPPPPEEMTQRLEPTPPSQMRNYRGWSIVPSDPLPSIPSRARRLAQSSAPPQEPSAGKRKKLAKVARILVGIVLFLLLFTILGTAALFGFERYRQLEALLPTPPTGRGGPQPTVTLKPGYAIYHDSPLSFSIEYPLSWQVQPANNQIDKTYHGESFIAGIYQALYVGSSSLSRSQSPSQIDDNILNSAFPLTTLPNHLTIISNQLSQPNSPTVHIVGLDWTEADADVTLSDTSVIHMACLALIHQGKDYSIFYYAPQDQFLDAYNNIFEPMLISFRFLP